MNDYLLIYLIMVAAVGIPWAAIAFVDYLIAKRRQR